MKNNENLLTIGEIAKTIGITRRIIINYEAHGLIHADTRGEFDSGYRYYSMDTLVRIRTIRTFQNLGLSLDEIKEYLDDSADLAPALKRLETLREELDLNIERLRERMNQGEQGKIAITELPRHTVYRRTMRDLTVEARTKHLRDVAYTAVTAHGSDISKRMYFIEFPLEDTDLITYCACVPASSEGDCVVQLPPVKALTQYCHGAYENLPAVRARLLAYAKEHKIRLNGTCRHVYLEGPPQHKDPQKFITMVALLLDEAGH